MPDAFDVASFWRNLREGVCSVREVPSGRWDPSVFWSSDPRAPDKTYSKIGSWVDGFEFDWRRFRIPPKVVESTDESQLWALEAVDQALRDSGYDARAFDRSRCAVVLGNAGGGETRVSNSLRIYYYLVEAILRTTQGFASLDEDVKDSILAEFKQRFQAGVPPINEDTMPGELSNIIAGRVANVFDLGGKNFTIDAACASSVAAVETAIHALAAGECDMAFAGAFDRMQEASTFVKFAKIGALSPDGSFPFDARANGFVMGEGGGVLLLKRLEDAERDGDRIYAVIRGVGSSSDGKGRGIVAPRKEGQVLAMRRALEAAGTDAGEIDLVECHGTGTVRGDATELEALQEVYGRHLGERRVPIGSVKSNIGHLKSAAGTAALIKVVMALRERTLPASVGYSTPNPALTDPGVPFYVNATTTAWPEPEGGRARRAAVSNFGFGGTNFHLIVEEWLPGRSPPATNGHRAG